MSLSDNEQDAFKPIDLKTLDAFDDELSHKSDDTRPDLARFKMLFDPTELGEQGPISFETLFSFDKEAKTEPFEPLIKETRKDRNKRFGKASIPEPIETDAAAAAVDPEISIEEQAFEQGYAKGFEQGRAEGLEKGIARGYAQGFKEGEPKGFEKGESEGFAKGETLGFDKGYQEGREKAEAQIREDVSQILEPLKEALMVSDRLLDDLIEKYEAQIVSLVFKISEKAVMATLEKDVEIVKHTILDAVKSLVAPEEITLNVASEDYDYIEMVKDEFFEAVGSLKHVAVKSDPLIKRGGCKIETATASISTDPEAKLSVIYDAIKKAVVKTAGPI